MSANCISANVMSDTICTFVKSLSKKNNNNTNSTRNIHTYLKKKMELVVIAAVGKVIAMIVGR